MRKKVRVTGSSPVTLSPRAQRGASKTVTSGSIWVRGTFLTSTDSADAAPAAASSAMAMRWLCMFAFNSELLVAWITAVLHGDHAKK